MSDTRHVRILIGVDGSCQVDALNFPDAGCLSATREITDALAGRIRGEQLKPESRIREQRGCTLDQRERAT